jgi:hypothetical protein
VPIDLGHVLPSQLARRGSVHAGGATALCAAVLAGAVADAGLGPARATPPRRSATYARTAAALAQSRRELAIAWLLGALEDQVQLPVHTVCAALGVDPDALAQAVRRRSAVPALPDVRPRRAS